MTAGPALLLLVRFFYVELLVPKGSQHRDNVREGGPVAGVLGPAPALRGDTYRCISAATPTWQSRGMGGREPWVPTRNTTRKGGRPSYGL